MDDCTKIVFSSSKLKKLRKKNGLTQEEMAKKVGVSQTGYGFWERGERTPNATFYLRLLMVFGLMKDPFALAVRIGECEDG